MEESPALMAGGEKLYSITLDMPIKELVNTQCLYIKQTNSSFFW